MTSTSMILLPPHSVHTGWAPPHAINPFSSMNNPVANSFQSTYPLLWPGIPMLRPAIVIPPVWHPAEFFLRTHVRNLNDEQLAFTIARILPQVKISKKKRHQPDFHIAGHETIFVPEFNKILFPGMWIDARTSLYGDDIISLLAYTQGITYDSAVHRLADMFGIATVDAQPTKIAGWTQVHAPLWSEYPGLSPVWQDVSMTSHYRSFYYNANGLIIECCDQGFTSFGQPATRYITLLEKQDRPGRYRWAEVMPKKPYMLYAADRIGMCPYLPVHFVENEALADHGNTYIPEKAVHTTVPGGLGNFPDADLRVISGRTVHLFATAQTMQKGLMIYDALKRAGISDADFTVVELGNAQIH